MTSGYKGTCFVCCWQVATRKGRCNSCRLFERRHGRDKTVEEVVKGYERALDRVGRIVLPRG